MWTCRDCKQVNFEVQAEAKPLLGSKSGKRICIYCGHQHVGAKRSSSPSPALKIAYEIERETGAKLVLEIDQTYNSDLAKYAKAKLSGAGSGICAAGTAKWIGFNKDNDRTTADDLFQESVQTDIKELVVAQALYDSEMKSRNILSKDYQAKIDSHNEALKAPSATAQEVAELRADRVQYQGILKLAHAAEIKRQGGGHEGEEVTVSGANQWPVKDLHLSFLKSANATGFGHYVLHFEAKASGGTGHIIGLDFRIDSCRLLDFNSGEWLCSGPPQLQDLLKAIVSNFYTDYHTYALWYYK